MLGITPLHWLSRLGVPVLFVALQSVAYAEGTQLLDAAKLTLRERKNDLFQPEPALARVISRDPRLALGRGVGSLDDPTLHGGSIEIVSLANGFEPVVLSVNNSLWRRVPKGHKKNPRGYRTTRAADARIAILPGKRPKLTIAAPMQDDLNLGSAAVLPVAVLLTIGEHRYCFEFTPSPDDRLGTRRLVAKMGAAPAQCALIASGTTSTSMTTTISSTVASTSTSTTVVTSTSTTSTSVTTCSARFCDLGDGTVYDSLASLQWERKDTAVGSGEDPANLHDVDNRYSWAGRCGGFFNSCQPSDAAIAACQAQTDSRDWDSAGCRGCALPGNCVVSVGTTTVWEWLSQLNATQFAGYSDWRLPTSAGGKTSPTNQPAEIESIKDPTLGSCAGGTGACISDVFGPTSELYYWSSSTYPDDLGSAYSLLFQVPGGPDVHDKASTANYVRAVRP